ncbi:MAG: quinone-dependent dihydroorotate dehydrogenase [Bacteroidales bacterium]|nr:quinone-dependent dihydroorotate dehydrogenase [Bacteroidales bacterium]
MYKYLIRPLFFLFKPELIHSIVFFLLKAGAFIPGISYICRYIFVIRNKKLEKNIFGMNFSNLVGLAAGMDKDAEVFDMFSNLGFSHIEIGTVTPKAQPGNPKPRLFRLKKDKALINRMGFNNHGVDFAVKKLKTRKSKIIIGGNIGKNKNTPNEDAVNDYEICFEALYPYVDYFVVNVSSPNTPDLRDLQEKEPLKKLLEHLKKISLKKDKQKPILLKIAPDLTNTQLDDIIDIVKSTNIDGIVATNTTILRNGLSFSKEKAASYGEGGLSGKPLKNRSTEVIRYISEKSGKTIPIIGVGGIMSPEDAMEKLNAGACLVQLYTGFVYEGPGLVKRINEYILKNS